MHGCFIMPSETVTCTWYFCHWMHSQHSIDLKNAVMERGNCEWCDLFVADNYRRSVVDRSTGQKVILSDEDIALASSLVKGKYSSPGYNPYEVNICINGLWLCFLTTLWHLLSSITYARLHVVILLFQLQGTPIRSSQLPHGRTIHLEFSSSTATQLLSYIRIPSWSENWTVYQSVSLARLWLFLAVRAG